MSNQKFEKIFEIYNEELKKSIKIDITLLNIDKILEKNFQLTENDIILNITDEKLENKNYFSKIISRLCGEGFQKECCNIVKEKDLGEEIKETYGYKIGYESQIWNIKDNEIKKLIEITGKKLETEKSNLNLYIPIQILSLDDLKKNNNIKNYFLAIKKYYLKLKNLKRIIFISYDGKINLF
jgi:hypothetical protein